MITAIAGNMQPLTQSSQWIMMITFRDKWLIHIYDYPAYHTIIANSVIIIMNCELWIMNCTKWIMNYESPTIRWI